MDRYAEMLSEIEHSDHPLQTIQTLQRMACTVCEAGPAREGILWAASFLAALSDYNDPRQLSLLTDYSEATPMGRTKPVASARIISTPIVVIMRSMATDNLCLYLNSIFLFIVSDPL